MIEWNVIWSNLLAEFLLLLKTPLFISEIWWIISPLIIITILMTFYFGRYVREKLGWNTALSNSIVLFFVGVDLLRTVYQYTAPPSLVNYAINPIKVIIILIVMIEGILLTYTAFTHALPAKIVFFIASPLTVNLQAYILIVAVYARLKPNIYTLFAAILLFIILLSFLRLLQELEHLLLSHHSKKKQGKITKTRRSELTTY